MFAEDAVWLAPGNGTLSGRKEGRETILAYFGELGTRSEGRLKVTLQDILDGENYNVALQCNQAGSGGRNLDMEGVIAFEVRDGQFTEGREFYVDTEQGDAFWA